MNMNQILFVMGTWEIALILLIVAIPVLLIGIIIWVIIRANKSGNSLQSIQSNKNIRTKKYSWWKYDDEYITGWQYMGRSLVGAFMVIILVGFYLQAVTAYKRAKSLGNSSSACNLFSVWGGLSLFIGLIPGVGLINIIPHWYLWFSNGPGYMTNNEEDQ